jgi:hypothetical protein
MQVLGDPLGYVRFYGKHVVDEMHRRQQYSSADRTKLRLDMYGEDADARKHLSVSLGQLKYETLHLLRKIYSNGQILHTAFIDPEWLKIDDPRMLSHPCIDIDLSNNAIEAFERSQPHLIYRNEYRHPTLEDATLLMKRRDAAQTKPDKEFTYERLCEEVFAWRHYGSLLDRPLFMHINHLEEHD